MCLTCLLFGGRMWDVVSVGEVGEGGGRCVKGYKLVGMKVGLLGFSN